MIRYKRTDRESVDAWYKAAIEAGGKDNGKPGIRSHYHANYYGAFVIVSGIPAVLCGETWEPNCFP